MKLSKHLLQKELQQNMVIYLIPFLCLGIIWVLNAILTNWLEPKWAQILAGAIPLALAGAYGLQAFDLEENNQTKDFLLTRPLSIAQIISSKYLCGLILLLPLAYLWSFALTPQVVRFPSLTNFSSFFFVGLLILTWLIYTTSFTVGLYIKGSLKLLGALLLIPFIATWFGVSWFQGIAWLIINFSAPHETVRSLLLFVLITASLIIFLTTLANFLSSQKLQTLPLTFSKKTLIYLILSICLPLFLSIINQISHPAIRPFTSLMTTIFGNESWFLASEGSAQPNGDLYLFRNQLGQLGLGKLFQKPQLIYQGVKTKNNEITELHWSLDGKCFSFNENGQVKVYSLTTKKATPLAPGKMGLWSNNSQQLLLVKELSSQTVQSNYGVIQQQHLSLNISEPPYQTLSPPKWELQTASIALGWDDKRTQLLAIDHSWQLKLLNLNNVPVRSLSLNKPETPETIILSQILPWPKSPHEFQLIIYSFDQATLKSKQRDFNLHLYRYTPPTTIKKWAMLNDLSYRDFILINDQQYLAQTSLGIYWRYNLPKEAR